MLSQEAGEPPNPKRLILPLVLLMVQKSTKLTTWVGIGIFYHIDFTTAFKNIPNGMGFSTWISEPTHRTSSILGLVGRSQTPRRRLSYQALMLSAAIVPGRGVGSWLKPLNGFKGNGGFQTRQGFVLFGEDCIAQQDSIFAIFFWGLGEKAIKHFESRVPPGKMVHLTKKKRRGGGGIY